MARVQMIQHAGLSGTTKWIATTAATPTEETADTSGIQVRLVKHQGLGSVSRLVALGGRTYRNVAGHGPVPANDRSVVGLARIRLA